MLAEVRSSSAVPPFERSMTAARAATSAWRAEDRAAELEERLVGGDSGEVEVHGALNGTIMPVCVSWLVASLVEQEDYSRGPSGDLASVRRL